ncbi:MAG: hypothetical protein ABIR26_08795 [Ramlibacter sp.]
MLANLARRAAFALVNAMHLTARRPSVIYLDVPARWREADTQIATLDAAARELGPFAMRQAADRFSLRFVAGLAEPVLVIQWHGRAGTSRVAIP